MNTRPKPKLTPINSQPEAVPAAPGAGLGRLFGRSEGGGYLVEIGGRQCLADADTDVDPALLAEVLARRGRVVLDTGAERPVIVGVLQTRRALELDRQGRLIAELDELALT